MLVDCLSESLLDLKIIMFYMSIFLELLKICNMIQLPLPFKSLHLSVVPLNQPIPFRVVVYYKLRVFLLENALGI